MIKKLKPYGSKKNKARQAGRLPRLIKTLLIGSLSVCMIGCGWKLCEGYKNYARGEADLAAVHAIMEEKNISGPATGTGKNDTQSGSGEETESGRQSLAASLAFARLQEWNPDAAAWLRIPDTEVDYPVMLSPGRPDFYLKHGFDQKPSAYGMIYADTACSTASNAVSRNTVLYGHHMKNGAMFGSLENYLDPAYRKAHSRIYLDWPDAAGTYEVFAVLCLSAAEAEKLFSGCFQAKNPEEYAALLQAVQEWEQSEPAQAALPQWPARLLTLVTCEYRQKNGRMFVFALEQ